MKILLGLLIVFSVHKITIAQTVKEPDYSAIEAAVSDQKLEYYYPTLRTRLDRRDTTLTLDDYRHLYYGFFFQPDFSLHAPEQEELDLYFRKENLSDGDCRKIIELAGNVLKAYPFDLRRMSLMIYAYRQLKEESSAKLLTKCYSSIIDIIRLSGDGKTCETGYHVISISHEYTIMAVSRLSVASQALVNHCDYLKAQENDKQIEGLYFDITMVLKKETAAFGGDDLGKKTANPKKKRKKKEK